MDQPMNPALLRRSTRLTISVPIQVIGTDAEGKPFSESTQTIGVNKHGGKFMMHHEVRLKDPVVVENPRLKVSAKAVIAWMSERRVPGRPYEVGIALTEPQNIWGVQFPPQDWGDTWQAAQGALKVVPKAAAPPPAGVNPAASAAPVVEAAPPKEPVAVPAAPAIAQAPAKPAPVAPSNGGNGANKPVAPGVAAGPSANRMPVTPSQAPAAVAPPPVAPVAKSVAPAAAPLAAAPEPKSVAPAPAPSPPPADPLSVALQSVMTRFVEQMQQMADANAQVFQKKIGEMAFGNSQAARQELQQMIASLAEAGAAQLRQQAQQDLEHFARQLEEMKRNAADEAVRALHNRLSAVLHALDTAAVPAQQ